MALSPSVAMKARCAARSSSVTALGNGTRRSRRKSPLRHRGGGRAALNRGKIAIEFGPGVLVKLPFQ
jgi:hypothetical protein